MPPKFICKKCGKEFSLPIDIIKKYPNWTPNFCPDHLKNKTAPKDTNSKEKALNQISEGIFTDGGASPNPGPGGWGVVYIKNNKIIKEMSGSEPNTTNNRMELTALLKALEIAPKDKELIIYSDSNLCVKTFNEWAHKWKKNGWKKKGGEIKNLDLIKKIFILMQDKPNIKLQWIPAHSNIQWNEYAHNLSFKKRDKEIS